MKEVNTVARTLSIGNGGGGSSDTALDCRTQLSHGCAARILRYDPGIPSVMPVAGGCLTMKNECHARLFFHDAWLFLLTLVTFSYFFYWW